MHEAVNRARAGLGESHGVGVVADLAVGPPRIGLRHSARPNNIHHNGRSYPPVCLYTYSSCTTADGAGDT